MKHKTFVTKFLKQGSPLESRFFRSNGPLLFAKALVTSLIRSSVTSDARAECQTTWLDARAWISPLELTSCLQNFWEPTFHARVALLPLEWTCQILEFPELVLKFKLDIQRPKTHVLGSKMWKCIIYHENVSNMRPIVQNHDLILELINISLAWPKFMHSIFTQASYLHQSSMHVNFLLQFHFNQH